MDVPAHERIVYFTFRLNTGFFAIPVTAAREVLHYEKITTVPRTPVYMHGVTNIRGSVITLIDFRVLFAFPVPENYADSPVIVTEIDTGDEQPTVIGILADAVDGVSELEEVSSNQTSFGNRAEIDFVDRLAKKGNDFVLILNLRKIFDFIESDIAAATEQSKNETIA